MNKMLLTTVALFVATQGYAATTTSNATAVTPAAGSQVSVKADAVSAKKSLVKLNYTAENSAGMVAANKGAEGAINSVQHVGVAYDLGNGRSAQYRQYFFYNLTEADARDTAEWSIGDHVFRYSDSKMLATEALPISTEFRLSIGGNRYAREIGQYILRNDSALAQNFGKTTVEYGVSTRVYAYSGESAGQQSLRVLPSVDVAYAANSVVTPFVTVFTDNRWYRTGKGVATVGPKAGDKSDPKDNKDLFNIDLGARFALGKNVNLAVYGETTTDMQTSASAKDNQIFDQDNTNYMLDFSVSM
jgi:hypothetical protein